MRMKPSTPSGSNKRLRTPSSCNRYKVPSLFVVGGFEHGDEVRIGADAARLSADFEQVDHLDLLLLVHPYPRLLPPVPQDVGNDLAHL